MRSRAADRRQQEKQIVSLMISIYCRKRHRSRGGLCPKCAALEKYAAERSERCPFMENKTFCSNCKVHCYSPEMREEIKKVMRFSGPRMIAYHPVMATRHVKETKKEKRRREEEK